MKWSQRRLNAAASAIALMLAGEDHEGGWPSDVSREDLEGALSVINHIQSKHERTEATAREISVMTVTKIVPDVTWACHGRNEANGYVVTASRRLTEAEFQRMGRHSYTYKEWPMANGGIVRGWA